MTEDQKQTVIESLERIVKMTATGDADTMEDWAVKASHQQALLVLRIIQSTMTNQ